MRLITFVLSVFLFTAVTPSARVFQSQSPAGPTFDVVSVKPNTSGTLGSSVTPRPDGGTAVTNVPVRTLIGQSAVPPPVDIVGLPDWASRDRYDIIATASLRNPTADDRRAMMLALLADRFRYVAHMEKREQDAYDLVLARSDGRLGSGLKRTEVDCAAIVAGQRAAADAARAAGQLPPRPPTPAAGAPAPLCSVWMTGPGMDGDMTMPILAAFLRPAAGRVVVDKTGLTGYYRVTLEYNRLAGIRPPSAAPSVDDPPSVFSALPEQLGLKLEPSKAQVDVLVIDRLERPSEN